jgi:hypothetical protein
LSKRTITYGAKGAAGGASLAEGHYAQWRCPDAWGLTHGQIDVTARHSVGAGEPSPRALSEGIARVGSQRRWSSEERRGRRMSPGLPRTFKSLNSRGRSREILILDVAGVKDQGQISKMMIARLESQGLIENTGA